MSKRLAMVAVVLGMCLIAGTASAGITITGGSSGITFTTLGTGVTFNLTQPGLVQTDWMAFGIPLVYGTSPAGGETQRTVANGGKGLGQFSLAQSGYVTDGVHTPLGLTNNGSPTGAGYGSIVTFDALDGTSIDGAGSNVNGLGYHRWGGQEGQQGSFYVYFYFTPDAATRTIHILGDIYTNEGQPFHAYLDVGTSVGGTDLGISPVYDWNGGGQTYRLDYTFEYTGDGVTPMYVSLYPGLGNGNYKTAGFTAVYIEGVEPTSPPDEGIPEPATLLLFGTGALGAFGYARRRMMK